MARSQLARLARCTALAIGLVSASSVALHCGSDENSVFPDKPCESTLKGKCGKACTGDTECDTGLYCGANRSCTADCSAGQTCSSGVVCSSRGQCGFGSNDGVDSGNGSCATTEVSLTQVVPKVLFLLDQSSSMFFLKFPSGDSGQCKAGCRWTTLKDALIGPAASPGGLLKDLEGQAEIALKLYSATDPNQLDGDNSRLTGPADNVCPRFNGKTFDGLSFQLNGYANAEALLRNADVDDDTPTGPAIQTVIGLKDDGSVGDPKGFAALASETPKILVLVTDGEPTVCNSSTPSEEGKKLVVKAVQDTFKQKITTVVVAIGDASNTAKEHFNEVANAGQGLDPATGTATAFLPTTPQAIVDALKKVVLDTRSCTYDLDGNVATGQEKQGEVTVNGTVVPYDEPGGADEGWRLATPSRLELVGSACAAMKAAGGAKLAAHFPCGSIIPR